MTRSVLSTTRKLVVRSVTTRLRVVLRVRAKWRRLFVTEVRREQADAATAGTAVENNRRWGAGGVPLPKARDKSRHARIKHLPNRTSHGNYTFYFASRLFAIDVVYQVAELQGQPVIFAMCCI